jgi:uncharacterized Zn finger protein (UPF0148 family)
MGKAFDKISAGLNDALNGRFETVNNDLCPHCGASLHFNDEIGIFCPACAQQKDAFQAAWEATRRNANEAAKQRRASDIALAATEAERVARALRGEKMPPPFAVCEGHEKRIAALEAKADWEEDATDEWARGINGRLDELLERLDGNDGLTLRVGVLEADQADTSSTLLTVTGRSVERLEALEASVAALWQAMEVQEAHDVSPRLARLESYANELEAAFGALADGTPVDEARERLRRLRLKTIAPARRYGQTAWR